MSASNAGEALATVMVDEFVRCGVTQAFLGPGSRSTPLALALAKRAELDVRVGIDERSVAFAALGAAKVSGRPAVVLTTSGSATVNLAPAVVEAFYAGVPMIVVTADRPVELRDTGAGQTIDQIKLYGGFVRWFVEVGVPEARAGSVGYWRSVAARGFHTSVWPQPGPVHLNIGFRDPLVPEPDEAGFDFPLDGREGGAPWVEVSAPAVEPDAEGLRQLAAEMNRARRGLIVAGEGNLDADPIIELAAAAGWPLLAEAASGVRADPAISTYEAILRSSPTEAYRPDLVVRFGNLSTSPTLLSRLDPGVRQVWIDPFGWSDPRRAASWILRADPARACRALAGKLRAPEPNDWLQRWQSAESVVRPALDGFLDSCPQVTEPRVARDLAAGLPDYSILYVASSMPIRDLDWFMRPRRRIRIRSNRGANGIDGFVSCVLGASAQLGEPVCGLCGDLCFLHDQNGLLLASGGSLDAVFVVVNNDGGGIFSFLPQAAHPGFEKLFGTPQGTDFEQLSRSYGCGYHLISTPLDLAPTVNAALDSGGVHIVEVTTSRERNVEMHRMAWQRAAAALSR
ncbi:MAG: 2-succinyl-5-enolpyruvyl-6-hydroxy-3-cyclohexene-1-carboxylic-acid synthase [Actinomycetota bacterium]